MRNSRAFPECHLWATQMSSFHRFKTPQTNLQLSLHHVQNQPVHPASFEQVPRHASKVPGGAQEIVFAVFVQVFIGSCMYLHTHTYMAQRGIH